MTLRADMAAIRPVQSLDVDARARFMARTYTHLLGAIALFVGLEVLMFRTGTAEVLAGILAGNWLIVLGAFMLVGMLGSGVAHSVRSRPAQYLALGVFVLAEAVVFTPLLVYAFALAPGAIPGAAAITMAGFIGLTSLVLLTRRDFSFLRSLVRWVAIAALLGIAGGLIFGFELGTWFSVAMIGLAGASILYDTSRVLLHYPEDRYVAAALELFASIALMFWYVLRIFTSRD